MEHDLENKMVLDSWWDEDREERRKRREQIEDEIADMTEDEWRD